MSNWWDDDEVVATAPEVQAASTQPTNNWWKADELIATREDSPQLSEYHAQRMMEARRQDAAQATSSIPAIIREPFYAAASQGANILSTVARPFSKGIADYLAETGQQIATRAEANRKDDWAPWASRIYGGVLESSMQSVVAAPAGPYGMIGSFALTEGNQALYEAEQAGLKGNDRLKYAATQGVIEGAIATVFQKFAPGLEKFIPQIASGSMKLSGSQFLKMTAQELPEELLTEVGHAVTEAVSGVRPDAMEPEKFWPRMVDTVAQTLGQLGLAQASAKITQNRQQVEILEGIRSKGFVTEQEAAKIGLTPEESKNRAARKTAVDQRIEQIEQQTQQLEQESKDAGAVPSPEAEVRQEQGGEDVRRQGQEQVRPEPAGEVAPAPEVQPVEGLEDLGQAGGAIVDNFYSGILESLKSKGRVPSAESKSSIGRAWDRAKDSMSPEEFVDRLRREGPDTIAPPAPPEAQAVPEAVPQPETPPEAAQEPQPAPEKRRGRKEQGASPEVMLGEGETATTSSGRQTSPFPKIDTSSGRKAENTVKRVDKWLWENAVAEARSRGDEFVLSQFENEDPARLPPATKDSMNEYLFGQAAAQEPKRGKPKPPSEPQTLLQAVRSLGGLSSKKIGTGERINIREDLSQFGLLGAMQGQSGKSGIHDLEEMARELESGGYWRAPEGANKGDALLQALKEGAKTFAGIEIDVEREYKAYQAELEQEARDAQKEGSEAENSLREGLRVGAQAGLSEAEASEDETREVLGEVDLSFNFGANVTGPQGVPGEQQALFQKESQGALFNVIPPPKGKSEKDKPQRSELEKIEDELKAGRKESLPGQRTLTETDEAEPPKKSTGRKKPKAEKQPAPTPMMERYQEVKREVPDSLLLFRMGDFYELFYDDAKTAAKALGLTLTTRDKGSKNPVPMAGFPYHQLEGYLAKLIKQGHKAAIAEMVEPKKTEDTGEGEGIASLAPAPIPTRQSRSTRRKAADEQAGIAAADIQKTVERLFGVAIRQGGFSQRAAGIYKWLTRSKKSPPSPEVVRTAEDHYANLAVVAHEVAHHIDETTKAVKGMPPEVREEIKRLDYEPQKGRAFEGWAEFLRRYITQPPIDVAGQQVPNAGIDAPRTLAWFEGTFLPAHADLSKSIAEFRKQAQQFAQQSVWQRIGTLIADRQPQDLSFKAEWLRKSRRTVNRLKTDFLDKFHTLDWIQQEARRRGHKGVGIYDLTMAHFMSASSHATIAFEEGVRSLQTGKPIGKTPLWGLRDHLESDEEYDDAVLYALARHTLFMQDAKPGYSTGMDIEDAEAWVAEVEANGKTDQFEAFAQGLAKFNNDLLKMLVEAGALPADQAENMLKYYGGGNYFPLHRVQDVERSVFAGSGVGFVNLGKAVRGRSSKGSGRQIIDPIDATVAQAIRFYGRAIQARQAHVLAETLDPRLGGVGGMGGLMDRVDPRKTVTHGTIEEILKTLVGEGVIEADDAKAMRIAAKILESGTVGEKALAWFAERHGLEEQDGEYDTDALVDAATKEPDALAVISLWRPDYTPNAQKRTVVIYNKKGEPLMYEMDPDLYATATGMEELQFGPFMSTLREAARWFKAGAVALSTGFGTANLLRDYWEFQGKARHAKGLQSLGKPPEMLGRYVAEKARKLAGHKANDPLIRLLEESGGKVYSVIGHDVESRRRYRRRRIGKSTMSKLGIALERPGDTAENALQAMMDVIAISDAPPRLADAEAAIKEEGFEIRDGQWFDVNAGQPVDHLPEHVRIKAAVAMAEATINFKRIGAKGQYIESFLPFFNATVQAMYRQYGQIKGLKNLGKQDVEGMRAKRYMVYLSALVATGIVHWLLRHDDDDWREQDAHLRDGYWTWGKNGKTYVRIPKPRDTAIVSNIVENMLDAWYHDDARDTSNVVLRDFGGRLPTGGGLLRGAIESLVADYDYFRDQKLTPDYLKHLPKEQQITPYTSRASDAIGRFTGRYLGTSPIQVEHLLNSASGGFYHRIADLYDASVDGRLGPEHIPFLRGLVIDRHQARSVSTFYDELEATRTQGYREAADGKVSDETIRKQAVLEAHAELMTGLRNLERKVGKRRDYQYQPYIVGLARHSLGYEELESNPNPLTDKDAPEQVKAVVRDYSMRVVDQATEPLKDKSEYEGEEYEAQRQSQIRGQAKLDALGLTREQAQQLLTDYYIERYGRLTESYSAKSVALAELYDE